VSVQVLRGWWLLQLVVGELRSGGQFIEKRSPNRKQGRSGTGGNDGREGGLLSSPSGGVGPGTGDQ
jgi:hypothetical protein